jgi:hypothetical protein
MLDYGSHRDAIHLRSVRMRGSSDPLRARLRFETAVAHVLPASLGLSARALLIVRRLAPATPLRANANGAFTSAVHADLARSLSLARRPWLHGDAGSAATVLFLDEAELAACFVRDWLKGRVTERWWWSCITSGFSIREWLRREVLARGEIFCATTHKLADVRAAAQWYALFDDADVAQAARAIGEAYGLARERPSFEALVADPAGFVRDSADDRGSNVAMSRAGIERLRSVAPESFEPALTPPQRRLLATALAVRRDLSWARANEFSSCLSQLGEPVPLIHDDGLTVRRLGGAPSSAQSTEPVGSASSGAACPAYAAEPQHDSSDSQVEPLADLGRELPLGGDSFRDSAGLPHERREAPADNTILPGSIQDEGHSASTALARVTNFGGIFYLLNVALALGLYGDFTAPRAPGLALSPWDLLALIGRRWFGREFRRDPVWGVLADLAGRRASEFPARAFRPDPHWAWPTSEPMPTDMPEPTDELRPFRIRTRRRARTPRERWLNRVLARVEPRIGLALQLTDSRTVADVLCRHVARVVVTATAVDIHLLLSDLPLTIRCAGLDRNPGWIPAAGRSVSFFFE